MVNKKEKALRLGLVLALAERTETHGNWHLEGLLSKLSIEATKQLRRLRMTMWECEDIRKSYMKFGETSDFEKGNMSAIGYASFLLGLMDSGGRCFEKSIRTTRRVVELLEALEPVPPEVFDEAAQLETLMLEAEK